jgi:hypothetical protein
MDPQALDLVGLARESAAVVLVMFWLTNGRRPEVTSAGVVCEPVSA